MSVRGPLVAECEWVSAEEREAFLDAFMADRNLLDRLRVTEGSQPSASMTRCTARWRDEFGEYSRGWESRLFACCMTSVWWAPASMHIGVFTPPPCPNCDPVGARKSAADAISALASDIISDRAMLEAVIAAGRERVAVLLDVSQDGKPLGRLQHPDDKAEIDRLREQCNRLDALSDALQRERMDLITQVEQLRSADPWTMTREVET